LEPHLKKGRGAALLSRPLFLFLLKISAGIFPRRSGFDKIDSAARLRTCDIVSIFIISRRIFR